MRAYPQPSAELGQLRAGRGVFWSAAGSVAPRRFGFGARVTSQPGLNPAACRKYKAPSPLRSAGALQNQAAALIVFRPHFESTVQAVHNQQAVRVYELP